MFFPTQKYALPVKYKKQVTIADIAVIENPDNTIELEVSDEKYRRFLEITHKKSDQIHPCVHLEFRHSLPDTLCNEKRMKRLCNGILKQGIPELRLPENQKISFSYNDRGLDKSYAPLVAMLKINTEDCAWPTNKKPRFLKRGFYTNAYN